LTGGGGRKLALAVVAAAVAVSAAVAGCGSEEPRSAARSSDFKAALKDAPQALRQLYSRPSEIVSGGVPAFRRQLESIRGYPVVVNKWASWCGPCRFEFPFFQRLARTRGARVAFLAVDSRDNRGDGARFLRRFPVPYPSFFDPDGKVAQAFRGDRVSPTTAFYDRKGELVFTKQGGYASESAIARDVDRYAR
jgi:cytochrome c biogenesis protein CcmG/thiol:disulfide interchange protein DsbE